MHILQYSVRLPMILKYFGHLCIALATLTLVPLLFSLFLGDYVVSMRYAVVVVAVALIGLFCSRIRPIKKMQQNEAVVITVLIFLFSPLVMTWPLMASGLSFQDALFETISAVTTTGLSTVATLETVSNTFLFSRAWMQWVGGLGIVVLCMAALIQPGMAAKRLNIEEDFSKDIIGGTRSTAQAIIIIYTIMTMLGFLAMMLTGVDWFTSLLYVLSAVSTGGFAPQSNSLAALDSFASQTVVTILSLGGALSLLLYYQCYHRQWKSVFSDKQFQGFIIITIGMVFLLAGLFWLEEEYTWWEALRYSFINGSSAISTSGFSSVSIKELSNSVQFLLVIAMSIGGCAGSTAGGIKIVRILILFRMVSLLIQRSAAPAHAVIEQRFNARKLSEQELFNAMSLFVVFVTVISLSWAVFLIMDQPPIPSLFEVVSALATVGLSTGITSSEMHPLLKSVLCFNMLFGRLEIIAWLIFFYPRTWLSLKMEE